MTKVSVKWVPSQRVLSRIFTGAQIYNHYFEAESDQDSIQWHRNGTAPPKKYKVSQSAGKFMATFFWDSLLLIDYKNKGASQLEGTTVQYQSKYKKKFKEKDVKIKERCRKSRRWA